MAITAVILLSVVILLGILVATSFTSLGTRTMIANERVAYQALLAAESGINTFERRSDTLAVNERYYDFLNKDALNAWFAQTGLSSLTLNSDANAMLSVLSVDSATSSFTLQSKSNVAGSQGSKKILIDLTAYRGGRAPRVVAGLTSYVEARLTGSSGASGQDGSSFSGVVPVTTVATTTTLPANNAKTPAFNLTVAGSSHIRAGSYLQIGGHRYQVLSRVDTTLSAAPVEPVGASDRTITAGTSVDLVLAAPSADVPGRRGSAATFTVSDASTFLAGDTVYAGSFSGTVSGVDYDTNTLSVAWSGIAPTTLLPLEEGTPLRRDVLGAASAGAISTNGGATISNGQSANDTSRVPDPTGFDNLLFEQTFGMSEADMLSLPGVTTLTSSPNGPMNGITYLNSDWNGGELCGSGVLIVTGDAKFNTLCPAGFEGLVYVKGEYSNQGNAIIRGAVIVEGEQSTRLAGNGSPYKVVYDPLALLNVGTLFSPWQFDPIAGTWRQK